MILDSDASRRAVREFGFALPNCRNEASFDNAFIVGVPRSGTTVVSQALAYCSDLGYVDNLVARFAHCPELGFAVSCSLSYPKVWSGKSRYGLTSEISQPHEFGRFWRELLGYDGMFEDSEPRNLAVVSERLSSIADFCGKPMLYKAFHLIFHITELSNVDSQKQKWIWVKRDRLDTALSIVRMRERTTGLNEWKSLVPLAAQHFEDPFEQVVAQVLSIEKRISDQLDMLSENQFITVDYEEFAGSTSKVLRKIGLFLEAEILPTKLDEVCDAVRNVESTTYTRHGNTYDSLRDAFLNVQL